MYIDCLHEGSVVFMFEYCVSHTQEWEVDGQPYVGRRQVVAGTENGTTVDAHISKVSQLLQHSVMCI